MRTISMGEYTARVRRLKRLVSDLEADFNVDEGLTLVGNVGGKRIVLTGEPAIVEAFESTVRENLRDVLVDFDQPLEAPPFPERG